MRVVTKDPNQSKDLNKIINRIVEPKNTQLYESLTDKELCENLTGVNIKFEYLFGFKTEKNRQSLFYVHEYQCPAQCKLIELQERKKDQLKQATQNEVEKEFSFAERGLFELD